MSKMIRQRKRQRGLSTAGWIAVVGLFGLIDVSFFKVFPMYYENFKLKAVLESLQADVQIDPKSKRSIWESLQKRMFVDEIRSVKRENVEITRKDGKTTVTVTYEVRDDWIGNLFIGGRFRESIVIDR